MLTILKEQKTTFFCFAFSILAVFFTVLFGVAFDIFHKSFTYTTEEVIEALPLALIPFLFSVIFNILSVIFICRLFYKKKWLVALVNLGLLGLVAYVYVMIFKEPWAGYYLSIVLGIKPLFYAEPLLLP